LLFEAGALSKNLDRSKVCPILFGEMEPTDVKGPLVQFQAAKFSEDEMKRVLKAVNAELGDLSLAPDVLDKVFEMWWPDLEKAVEKQVSAAIAHDRTARRSDRDLLEEVLALTRNLDAVGQRRKTETIPEIAIEDLFGGALALVKASSNRLPSEEISEPIKRIHRSLRFLLGRGVFGQQTAFGDGTTLRAVLEEIESLRIRTKWVEPIEAGDEPIPDKEG
jgi:hypothetical protein